jgi:hypothetical protein
MRSFLPDYSLMVVLSNEDGGVAVRGNCGGLVGRRRKTADDWCRLGYPRVWLSYVYSSWCDLAAVATIVVDGSSGYGDTRRVHEIEESLDRIRKLIGIYLRYRSSCVYVMDPGGQGSEFDLID